MEIIIVRHGEKNSYAAFFSSSFLFFFTEKNVLFDRKSLTDWNPDLTDVGNMQTTLVGEYFKRHGIKFDHVYSSPLKRAVETALNITKVYYSLLIAIWFVYYLLYANK